jgi:tRNA pseudouridine38-40 synthase
MAEDTSTAASGMPAKRHGAQDAPQSSPKRVKVDLLQSTVGASPPDSNADIPQSNKKSQKKRDASGYPKSRRGKEKDNKNVGRRRRDRPERDEASVAEATEADPRDGPAAEKAPRLPKRQSAILLGFCGTGCAGMQMSVSGYRVGR